jgi:hypothetical protein
MQSSVRAAREQDAKQFALEFQLVCASLSAVPAAAVAASAATPAVACRSLHLHERAAGLPVVLAPAGEDRNTVALTQTE